MIIFLLSLTVALATDLPSKVKYEFSWIQPKTKFEIKLFQMPIEFFKRVGETGTYEEKLNLPIERPLMNSIELIENETAILLLTAKNESNRDVKFFVTPHTIEPPTATLGFKFDCLCYNHLYTAKAKKIWYRILQLKRDAPIDDKVVKLSHIFVRK